MLLLHILQISGVRLSTSVSVDMSVTSRRHSKQHSDTIKALQAATAAKTGKTADELPMLLDLKDWYSAVLISDKSVHIMDILARLNLRLLTLPRQRLSQHNQK